MFSNRDIFEVYSVNWSTKNVLEFLNQNLADEQEVIDRSCKDWVRRFNSFWKKIGSKERFLQRKPDWLDAPFMISPSKASTSRTRIALIKSTKSSLQKNHVSSPSELKTRGRKSIEYHNLHERTKLTYARKLAQTKSFEELLRAAETAAYKNGCPATKNILKLLRTNDEAWARKALAKLEEKETCQPSVETCLMLKTRLSLSKSKYCGISSFMRTEMNQKLVSWKDIMAYRNSIIPRFANPNEDNGYLSVTISLRDLISNDISRVMELEDIRSGLDSMKDDGFVDCILYVSAGPDSATGFSHYNQAKFLARDDSLFTEHFMSMRLETNNQALYIVPNPQSDTFCRVRRMCWTKETDVLTSDMYQQFFREIDEINRVPVEVQVGEVRLRIKVEGIYSMIDGKAANAIVGNRNTHGCPLCPPFCGINKMIGPSYFHSRLNAVEWLMRNAAKKAVPGNPAQSHPEVRKEARSQADELERHFKMNINRPKIGGCGSSNNGNMARNLLNEPEVFSKTLNISVELTKNLKLISSLALSSRKLVVNKVKQLFENLETQIFQEFDFVNRLPPCIHKYKHLAEYAEKLPYTMNYVDEQSGERCHKRYKFSRPHLSRKTSAEDNLLDMIRAALSWSDPKMSYLAYQTNGRTHRSKKQTEFEPQMEEYFDAEENRNKSPDYSACGSDSDDDSSSEEESESEEGSNRGCDDVSENGND